MQKIHNDSFLLKAHITKTVSKYMDDGVPYNADEVQSDSFQSILDLKNSLTIDKRATAIGTNSFCNREEMFFASVQGGWSHAHWVGINHYPQLIINLLKPKSALLGMPDSHFTMSSILAGMGCEITFINCFLLDLFEKYVYTHPEHQPYQYDYNVIDTQDIINPENIDGKKFDLIYIPYVWILLDPSIINNFINITESGGAIVVIATSDMLRMYKPEFHNNHIYDILKYINNIDEIYNFHLTETQGINVLIKK